MHSYASLPEGSVRLLQLLPSPDAESRIECRLLTFSRLDSQETHPYEALSYVWGDEKAQDPIYINSKERYVTANLFAALSHLRHCFLERILWIDAVCINQDDTQEKNHQVQSMAKIYAKARCVIVWLGEAIDNSARALEAIHIAAHRHHVGPTTTDGSDGLGAHAKGPANSAPNNEDREAVLGLLGRPWFRRVWVLQEVAAARYVLVKCGPVEMDGYAFCVGVDALNPWQTSTSPTRLRNLINTVAYLISGAGFRSRPRNRPASAYRFSLNIRPLCELVDMYQDRQATDLRDKVYALLGMSSDNDVDAAGLSADYAIPWRDVFRNFIRVWLSDRASVATWNEEEVAVVEAKGNFLGQVTSASEDATRNDRRHVTITWKHCDGKGKPQWTDCVFQASVKVIKEGDVVCLLEGASMPSIVRLDDGYSTIIVSKIPQTDNLPEWIDSIADFPARFLLVWDWRGSREMQAQDHESLLSSRGIPECPVAGCKCPNSLDKAARWWNTWLLLSGMERYGEATDWYLRKAVEIYNIAAASRSADDTGSEQHASWRKENEGALKAMEELYVSGESAIISERYKDHNLGPLQWASAQGCYIFARLAVEHIVNLEARDQQAHETPLQWAARTGSGLLFRLLIERGADTEAKYSFGQTPLQKAVAMGDGEAARLLAAHGADIEVKTPSRQTLVWKAAEGGHEDIVRTLAVHAGADIWAKDMTGNTPLQIAAARGHVDVVRVLVAEAGADCNGTDGRDRGWRTPLHCAAIYGHVAVVRLLVGELGADREARDSWGQTALHCAIRYGCEDVVRLLLVDLGANKEARDLDEQTPLHCAVECGRRDIVRLLAVELGADKEAEDYSGRRPLDLAVEKGFEAIEKILAC
ncbi:hypothetical protein MAPG_05273 [Magnaporthiopsis poae ATCC 64411]|uniref:Heterokaryon incompatibility domain-containing protein n=1 Tax=Magnaporthiopsis poae (strain ATCC 64411 / 73-15) TaxID=644358 RepID=A0A0C4DYY8_MAGP6|nr:hypothetical protein MAPG_05273 [Magnaporthiopsis poae ATCC 64411]